MRPGRQGYRSPWYVLAHGAGDAHPATGARAARVGERPRTGVARDRAERRSQHVPGRCLRSLQRATRRPLRQGDDARQPDPQLRVRPSSGRARRRPQSCTGLSCGTSVSPWRRSSSSRIALAEHRGSVRARAAGADRVRDRARSSSLPRSSSSRWSWRSSIPRSRPSFPGNRLGLFLVVCGVFFVAQLTAVLALAEVGEADEPAAAETRPSRRRRPRPRRPPPSRLLRRPIQPTETTTDAGRSRRRRRRGQRGLPRRGRLRGLPHARRRRVDRHDRAEPRRGEAVLRQGGLAGDERRRRNAAVRRHAHRAADPGRRGVRLLGRQELSRRTPR